ncbi:hypothetical protein GCM10025782_15680 [Pedococcus ginsenosidimutans]|uniref:Uncharacterized protein n=1 Tax=Pedococcus ginsenosidimutans TaxID=490570 RepID=A0ABP8Y358_9MICO
MELTDMRTPLSVETFTHKDAVDGGTSCVEPDQDLVKVPAARRLFRYGTRDEPVVAGRLAQRKGASSGSRVTSAPSPCMLSAKPA